MPTRSERTTLALRPIVFLGPSLPREEAEKVLQADFRPPIRRGDLAKIEAGRVVAIIDGVFDQSLSVSPREIRQALARGVPILGSSSMGALRAAEVPGVIGVGHVYEMYRSGQIEDDDEVAIVFDPESLRALSEPMVNIRYAVDRLARPGTISRELGLTIVQAAKRLPYPERVYKRIFKVARLTDRADVPHLMHMLSSYDVKREDALTLLERLGSVSAAPRASRRRNATRKPEREGVEWAGKMAPELPANAPVLFWEYGERVDFRDLLRFLKCTGAFEAHARNAVARFVLDGNELDVRAGRRGPKPSLLRETVYRRMAWDWVLQVDEEVNVTLRDVGLGFRTLDERMREELAAKASVMALAREESTEFLHALRAELFMSDLSLKRHTVRYASLAYFAARGRASGPLEEEERLQARDKVCELIDAASERIALEVLGWWGLSAAEVRSFIEMLAYARRAGGAVLRAMSSSRPRLEGRERGVDRSARSPVPAGRSSAVHLLLRASPKVEGSRRFCLGLDDAYAVARRLGDVVGVTRVGMITGLGDVGLPNAQAFRPDGTWSTTVGGGKSETELGAKIGAIMEEVEKWAAEQYPADGQGPNEHVSSFEVLRRQHEVVDPRSLDLPYDSRYTPDLEMGWRAYPDLMRAGQPVFVPSAAAVRRRLPLDIYYSERAGRKIFTTNGLASGFTLEEALTHSLCELIERHATVLFALVDGHRGREVSPAYAAIDLRTVPSSTGNILDKIAATGRRVRVFDITPDVRVPTFAASILSSQDASNERDFCATCRDDAGFAAHPDPEVAINMALLEASQTILSNVAGSREDLTVHARSLGRHERTLTSTLTSRVALRGTDFPRRPFDEVAGSVTRDARLDVEWILERLRDAGCPHVIVIDITADAIRPACVVRTLIPTLESINPFHTGPRARAILVRDLLPTP